MSNLLYDKGCVKVADFGLARFFSEPLGAMTPRVRAMHYVYSLTHLLTHGLIH